MGPLIIRRGKKKKKKTLTDDAAAKKNCSPSTQLNICTRRRRKEYRYGLFVRSCVHCAVVPQLWFTKAVVGSAGTLVAAVRHLLSNLETLDDSVPVVTCVM